VVSGFQSPVEQSYGGFRYAVSRDIGKAPWQRVYDLIIRLRAELPQFPAEYRMVVNRLLAGYRIAWDLGEDGRLHRVLPPAAQTQVEAAVYNMANNHFRHGMTTPFSLKTAEVDFVPGASVAGMLLFIRL
jgi:hypothetical protein